MDKKRFNIILIVLVLFLVGWMLKGTFTQPGIENLKTNFKEVAHYRNDNNTGPIQHVYAVIVNDTLWDELQTYGNFKPHHKGGNTKVYYFLKDTPAPEKLYAGTQNFDPAFNKYCIALYEKTAMGNASLKRIPFR